MNGTPKPAETPYSVTISPATPTEMPRLAPIGVSRPTGISSVVTNVNKLAVMTATPSHDLTVVGGISTDVAISPQRFSVGSLKVSGRWDR
jgi:hypothetical protein